MIWSKYTSNMAWYFFSSWWWFIFRKFTYNLLISVNDPRHVYLRHGKGSKCILGRSKLYQEFVIIQFASLSPMPMDKERTLSERRGKPPACDLIPGGGREGGLPAVSCLLAPFVQKCRRRDLAQSHHGLGVWPAEDTLLTRTRISFLKPIMQ